MELKDLLDDGIGPRSNGVITKEDMIYIFLGFNTEENQEEDNLIFLKLSKDAAYASKVIGVGKLSKEVVDDSIETSEYTKFEDLTIIENFVLFSLLKAFEEAINTSVNPDRPFVDTIIPALLDMLHLAADKIRSTEEGIKELAILAKREEAAMAERVDSDKAFDLMLHSLNIMGEA